MKKLTLCVLTAALSIAAAATCFAADSPWNGTWKENLAKAKTTGRHMVITDKTGGMMHFSTGAISYDFACDGKDYTVLPGQTLTCTGNPQAGYDLTMSVNGHVISKQHRTISQDGKEMMIKGTAYRADGSTDSFEEVRKREGGGTGLVGTWVEAKDESQKPDVQIWSVSGDTVQIQLPEEKVMVDAKLDGSDSKVSGPTVPEGATLALKSEGKDKLHFQRKVAGKMLEEGTYTLSADGKVMTQEFWSPGHESEKMVQVFDKQ